jgi:hypothetical protein
VQNAASAHFASVPWSPREQNRSSGPSNSGRIAARNGSLHAGTLRNARSRRRVRRKTLEFSTTRRGTTRAIQAGMWWPLKVGLVVLVYGWTALIIVFMVMGLRIASQLRRKAPGAPTRTVPRRGASARDVLVVHGSPNVIRGDWRPRRARLGLRLLDWITRRPSRTPREVARGERQRSGRRRAANRRPHPGTTATYPALWTRGLQLRTSSRSE